ncbi:hypothetical protein BDW67DRAFT_101371 [Aspergillus spinulosporus]
MRFPPVRLRGRVTRTGFRQTGFSNQPPLILPAAVAGLQALYEEEGHQLKENVQALLEGNKRLKRKYAQPPLETDRLLKASLLIQISREL